MPSAPAVGAYRARALAVRVMRYTVNNWPEIARWLAGEAGIKIGVEGMRGISIVTKRGQLLAKPNDYIVLNAKGRVDVWDPADFDDTFWQETEGAHLTAWIKVGRYGTEVTTQQLHRG